MAYDTMNNNFGSSTRNRTFYESALKDSAWVNLDTKTLTYTGKVVSFDKKAFCLTLNPRIGYAYAADGSRRAELLQGDLEIDLILAEIVSKSRTSQDEVNARVVNYNLEAEISKKLQLLPLAKSQ
jgi:hypothetical protein